MIGVVNSPFRMHGIKTRIHLAVTLVSVLSSSIVADAYIGSSATDDNKYDIYRDFSYVINAHNYTDNELGFTRIPPIQHYRNKGYARLEYKVEGSPRLIGIHLHYDGIRNEDPWIDGDRIARGLAVLPELVLRLVPRDFVIMTGHTGGPFFRACSNNDQYTHTGCGSDPEGINVIATPYTFDYMFPFRYEDREDPRLRGEWEEQVLHEFAHLLQHNPELSYYAWNEEAWLHAIEADGEDSQITEYGTTNDWEDFAETFVVWLIVRELIRETLTDEMKVIRDDVVARIPNRLAYFDEWQSRLNVKPPLKP
ncbi:MAG: hypothetical protein OXG05_10605 [Gammaproteobacteria bacterium]|nr:hypothetical protein [Gammaproteobacteria bacterium]